MRQVLIRRGQVEVAEVPAPLPAPGHALVEVAYSLISAGTETSSVRASGAPLLQRALHQPEKVRQVIEYVRREGLQRTIARVQRQVAVATPTGYSCAGIVRAVGEGVSEVQPGQRVACAGAGVANHAEVLLVPRHLLCPVPDGCDLRAAATTTLGAIALQGVRRAELRLGEFVAVIGLGLVGQLTVQLLRAAGCRVLALDIDPRRVALAERLGATRALLASEPDAVQQLRVATGGHGADAVLITAATASDEPVQQAMELARRKGRVVVVGDVGLGLRRSPFYEKELDLLISCSYGPGRYDAAYEVAGQDYPYGYVRWTENRNMAEYLRLVAEGQVNVNPILEREYELGDAAQAYADLREAQPRPLGVLLRYPLDELQASPAKLQTIVTLRPRVASDVTIGASRRIGIAVIGAGSFARGVHLPLIRELADLYDLRAVVSATGSNARGAAETFGAEYAATDREAVANDSGIQAVVIATRHDTHAETALRFLRAGKHVLLEKPLALTDAEVRQFEGFYAGRELHEAPLLLTGFNRRFSALAMEVQKRVAGRHSPMVITYRMNAGYLPPEHWVHGAEGGGRNLGEACHVYDLFTFLTGSEATRVETQSLAPSTGPFGARDNFVATVSFADGSLATLTYTTLGAAGYPKEQMEIFVDGRVLALTDYRQLTVFAGASRARPATTTLRREEKGHREELQAFARVIQEGGDWPNPLWQQVQATRIALEVERQLAGSVPAVDGTDPGNASETL